MVAPSLRRSTFNSPPDNREWAAYTSLYWNNTVYTQSATQSVDPGSSGYWMPATGYYGTGSDALSCNTPAPGGDGGGEAPQAAVDASTALGLQPQNPASGAAASSTSTRSASTAIQALAVHPLGQPRAGRRFTLAVTPSPHSCVAHIGHRRLPGLACAWDIPRHTRGHQLAVTVRSAAGSQQLTYRIG